MLYSPKLPAGAKEEKVPACVIFSNATLEDMSAKAPKTMDELLDISGVGKAVELSDSLTGVPRKRGALFLCVLQYARGGQGRKRGNRDGLWRIQCSEVMTMLAAAWLMLSSLLYSLQLSSGSFPRPLTREEEQYYLNLAAKGDLDARNVLVERNLRLVAHIMKKYYTQTADQEDLISIGTIGLMKGISTFDPSKGSRLATYAARCIENAILSQMR